MRLIQVMTGLGQTLNLAYTGVNNMDAHFPDVVNNFTMVTTPPNSTTTIWMGEDKDLYVTAWMRNHAACVNVWNPCSAACLDSLHWEVWVGVSAWERIRVSM